MRTARLTNRVPEVVKMSRYLQEPRTAGDAYVVALSVVQPVHNPLPVLGFGPERTWMVIVMRLGRSTSRTSVSHPSVAPASMSAQVNVVDAAHGATRTQSRVRTGPVVLGLDAITAGTRSQER